MSYGTWKGERLTEAMYVQAGDRFRAAGGATATVIGRPKEDPIYPNGVLVDTDLGRMYYDREMLLEVVG